jgi:hypothetical protein
MKNRKLKILLALFVLGAVALASACDWKKAERPLTAAGYNFHIGTLAAVKTAKAVHDCKNAGGETVKYKAFLNAVQRADSVGQAFSLQIDRTVEINPQSKADLLAAADSYLAELDKTIATIDPANVKLREGILIVRSTAVAFKLAISVISVPKPTAKVSADLSETKDKAVKGAAAADANTTVCLIDAIGVISADFAADVLGQKGLDAAALRTQRDVKFNAVQALIAAELAK